MVAIAAIVVALPVIWSIIESSVAISSLPEKVERIDKRLAAIEHAVGIWDGTSTNKVGSR